MIKKFLVVISIFGGISFAHAASCVDLGVNLSRGAESNTVLSFQNFLYEKGYLKAAPNGYFGPGTFAAVKAYQKSVGLSQVGIVGPGTRAAIKKESCGTSTSSPIVASKPTPTIAKEVVASSTPKPVPVSEEIKTPSTLRNLKRRADSELLLKTLARYFADSRGVHAVSVGATGTELCIKPAYVMPTATATEVAVLTSPVSPCVNYADVSYLASYLGTLPRDPSIATSSPLLGYTIIRNEYNDITIAPKITEDKTIIKVKCNFNAGCSKIEHISTVIYEKPVITSVSKPIFLRDSSPKTPINIIGKNFSLKNKVYLNSTYASKEYYLGEFSSTDGITLPINATSVNQFFPCGNGCSQKIPLGDYTLVVKNEGGSSNTSYLSIKGYTSSSFSARGDTSVSPKTTNVKLGTMTISSTVPLNLLSLTLVATSSKTNLPSKITKFVLKDPLTNTTISASGLVFSLAGQSLYENQSKLYDIYADVAEVLVADSGFISYSGVFLAKDVLLGNEVDLPVKEFSFTVSY